ncbi:MAG: DinB family protein [Actinobacteria bacterium]|nr:DinB family protein [Actinomycetota bacterium]
MKRWEIEEKLHGDRAWLLAAYADLTEEQMHADLTPSEHDPSNWWSALDHLAHLALIEHNFAQMVRRHVAGHDNPVGLVNGSDGRPRTRDEIMASVHAMTDEWQQRHHGKSFDEVVALGAEARAVTLQLLSELTDEQLTQVLPGAPWADGTVGGVLAANADHGRMHWKWSRDAGVLEK